MPELKGKPCQTLQGHLKDSFKVLGIMQKYRRETWKNTVSRLGFDAHLFFELLNLAIYAHDLGKSTLRWQNYLDTGKGRITHSLFSILMLRDLMNDKVYNTYEGMAALLAVLAHHGMLHENSFTGENITGMGKEEIYTEEVNQLLHYYGSSKIIKETKITAGEYSGAEGARLVSSLRKAVLEMEPEDKKCFKGIYTLFLSLLQLSDNEASYQYERLKKTECEELLGPLIDDSTDLHYFANSGEAFSDFKKSVSGAYPNDVQKAVLESGSPFLILQAGCGTGKTAAALHYSAALAESQKIDRVIITLPTRFTTNSIYWDFQQQYGLSERYTGIYHGEMESVLSSSAAEIEENDRHISDLKFENSFFNRSVNVCTVDHLLYSLLHCHKYSDRAFGNLMTSAVVFDEIHFYDAYTLQKIGQCVELLRELNIPHMVMSATIPESVVNLLNEDAELDGVKYDFIRQDEVKENEEDTPFKIVKLSSPLLEEKVVSQDLLALVDKNKSLRQMVVVNQVERAKEIARVVQEKWPEPNVICYHSEFSRRDRDEKERVIRALFKKVSDRSDEELDLISQKGFINNEQVILISTQICEMSLDISADVMYSEIAPADAVAQRGGRLHRKGMLWQAGDCMCRQCNRLTADYEYYMYLFPFHWENEKTLLPYHGSINGESILKKSWDVIGEAYCFSNVVDWVNKLYPEPPKLDDEYMNKMILEDAVFGRKPSERFGDDYSDESGGSFRVRHSDVATITVVPEVNLPQNDFDPFSLVKDYGIRVSLNKLRKFKDYWAVQELYKNGEKYKVHVLKVPYEWKYGFDF